jgi:predicted Zn-dependent protease
MRRKLLGLLVATMALAPAACTPVRNPATGQVQYTSLTPEQEKQLGRQEHPKALAEFGGQYADPKLQAYVERVGNRVKNASELKGEPFTFTVLDSDIVNACALPGGYIYITRGLLALANDEAGSRACSATRSGT